jgi:hypothetical protein
VGSHSYGIGWVYAGGQFENWNNGVGTTVINGREDGDLALVTMDANRTGIGRVYRDAWNSYTSAPVKEMWNSAPQAQEQYCTGGRSTGELCSWVVTTGNSNVTTATGLAKNVATGWRSPCVASGDSGGAVYTVRPQDGGIAAKGIINSVAGSCYMTFTDVRRATFAWPGLTLSLQ